MSDFRIFETDEFLKIFNKMSEPDIVFLKRKLDFFVYPQIRREPFWGNNIKKLKGYIPETWRYRIGKFRLFYIVDQNEQIIYMLSIDERKIAYR